MSTNGRAPKPMTVHRCDTCGTRPARFFFLGWCCTQHAPTEAQILRHAKARAAARDAIRARHQETSR